MFSFISGLYAWLTRKDELKVLIVGLDFSGKTTTLEQIKRAFVPQYRGASLDNFLPTIGMNLAKISTQHVDVTFWDVGGAMHSIWDRYYADADGLIFVVDASDPGRFDRVRSTLGTALQNEALVGIPVVILANKSDVRGSADTTTIHDRVVRGTSLVASGSSETPSSLLPAESGANQGKSGPPGASHVAQNRREFRIIRSSAIRGEGVKEAVDWLVTAAKRLEPVQP